VDKLGGKFGAKALSIFLQLRIFLLDLRGRDIKGR